MRGLAWARARMASRAAASVGMTSGTRGTLWNVMSAPLTSFTVARLTTSSTMAFPVPTIWTSASASPSPRSSPRLRCEKRSSVS